jgi:signal transduction histidine kinase
VSGPSGSERDLLRRAAEAPLAGAVAATLAHELAQPLAALEMRLDDAARLLRGGGDASEALARVEKALADARHAAGVVSRIRALSRSRDWTLRPTPLPPVIEGALALVEPLSAGVEIGRDLPAGLPPVMGDAVMLRQVIVNLARNGIEAMAGGGRRSLTVAARAEQEPGRTGRRVVTVTVADRGPGLAPEASARAGEAFFTTKAEGTGLGLSTSRTIAALHKGRLWHAPREGGGTVFSLSLPAA